MLGYCPNDGYIASAYVDGVPQLYDAARFKYRPILIEEGSEFFETGAKLKAREADRRTAKLLKDHVTSWSLTDAQGDALPISLAVLLRLNRRLFQRLAGIVLGMEASDSDPDWSEEEKDEALDAKVASLQSGRPPAALAEERDAKNSSTE